MITLDTNLLIRFATHDHLEQAKKAVDLIEGNPVYVPVTVLLETEWVLRSRYQYQTGDFVALVEFLLAQEQIVLEDNDAISSAINAHGAGMDFADALLCARAKTPISTFDQKLCKQAKALGFDVSLP